MHFEATVPTSGRLANTLQFPYNMNKQGALFAVNLFQQ